MQYDAFDAGIELGGLRNRDDIRLLICYLLKSVDAPMTRQMLNEAMQEDGLANYFEVGQAIEELLKTGNITADILDMEEVLSVTEKGREAGSLTEDSIAFTVKQRAENAVAKYNRQMRRSSFVKTQVIPRENGDCSVIMALDDEAGNLMTLELVAPDQRQAVRLSRLFEKKAEAIYNLTMAELLDDEDSLEE